MQVRRSLQLIGWVGGGGGGGGTCLDFVANWVGVLPALPKPSRCADGPHHRAAFLRWQGKLTARPAPPQGAALPPETADQGPVLAHPPRDVR